MTERSHGKVRPSLPRLKELPAEPLPPRDRTAGRDALGRFAAGSKQPGARSRGWRKALVQLAGPNVVGPEVQKLASESATLYRARLAELAHQGPTVSALVAEGARSSVLSSHLAARALAVGVETAKGRALLDLSMKLGQRGERTSVSAYDLAQRLAEAERQKNPARPPWLDAAGADVDDDEPEDAESGDAPESRPEASTRELDPMRPERTDAE